MNAEFSVPIAISLMAFFIADSENQLLGQIFRQSLIKGNRQSVEARLSKIGRNQNEDFENFRISQLAFIALGLLISTSAFFLGVTSWPLYCLSLPLISLSVMAATDHKLSKRCEERLKEIESEFPSVIEILTLAVGAGESPASALKRISMRANGRLADEFKRVVIEVEKGRSLTSALDDFSRRLSSDAIRRFVDSLAISISRGSSLVETLSHSASESRSHERVRLLTAAGKSEIFMMVPVVFLILPVSILFALYPSLANLDIFGGG